MMNLFYKGGVMKNKSVKLKNYGEIHVRRINNKKTYYVLQVYRGLVYHYSRVKQINGKDLENKLKCLQELNNDFARIKKHCNKSFKRPTFTEDRIH